MAVAIKMPQVGHDIESARIVEWHVAENGVVTKGDIVAVVESDKANFEIEAPADGTVLRIAAAAGEEARVFDTIAWIGAPGEAVAAPAPAATPAPAQACTPAPTPAPAAPVAVTRSVEAAHPPAIRADTRIFATPSAWRVAREIGISLASVNGTGPGGRIIRRDVLAFSGVPSAGGAPGPDYSANTEIPFTRMRRRIAERLARSKQTIPHFYLFCDVMMTDALEWRALFNTRHNCRITINDMIVKAAAMALAHYRRMNAHVLDDTIVEKKNINIGVAVSVPDGLLVPVVADADWKDLVEISAVSRKIVDDARRTVVDQRVRGTFTISNLGNTPVDRFLPIINPPECAILGVAGIGKRIIALPHGIGIADVMTLTLACDHRAVDGSYASGFLSAIKNNLEAYIIEA
jgi:pyruvate dehydrogenase E2 component (dihydrolipoamide acetyltransferase)